MKTDNRIVIQAILILGIFVIVIAVLDTLSSTDSEVKKGIVGDIISMVAIVFGAKTIGASDE